MCDSEAPLFVDVVVEQHAAKQPRRVAGRQAGGDGGGGPPVSSWPLRLQQVLPQDLHQVFIQAGMFGHGGHCQGVLVGHPHACLLGHACPRLHRHPRHQHRPSEWTVKAAKICQRKSKRDTKTFRFPPVRVQGFPQNVGKSGGKKN